MPSSISSLFALQALDQTLDAHRTALAAARAALEDDQALIDARASLDDAARAQVDAARVQREHEFEVDDLRAKVEPLDQKLYSGTIKSPKELQELDHQVTTFKEMLAEREAALLDQIAVAEATSAAVNSAQKAIQVLDALRVTDHARLRAEIAQHEAAIAELDAKRAGAAALTEAQVLRVYEQLRPRTGGRAVARVERGMCGGCRIGLPVNIVSRARSGTMLVQCTSCQRILLGS